MSSWNEAQVQEKILRVLEQMKYGSILEISRAASINRITLSKYLAVMEVRGMVSFRQIGSAKLYHKNLPQAAEAVAEREVEMNG